MSIVSKLFGHKSSEIALRIGIRQSKESLLRLKILTHELNMKEYVGRSHENLLEIASDEMESPMWVKDLEGRFMFMNVACVMKILRTTPDAALHLTDEDFENDALAQVCKSSDQVVIDTVKTHRAIEHARYADGSDLWVDTTKSPWIIDGELFGTVGFGRDITDYVPEDVREEFKESGFFEIPIDAMYNSDDIRELVEIGKSSYY